MHGLVQEGEIHLVLVKCVCSLHHFFLKMNIEGNVNKVKFCHIMQYCQKYPQAWMVGKLREMQSSNQ